MTLERWPQVPVLTPRPSWSGRAKEEVGFARARAAACGGQRIRAGSKAPGKIHQSRWRPLFPE